VACTARHLGDAAPSRSARRARGRPPWLRLRKRIAPRLIAFLSAHARIGNLFHLRRDHVSAREYRAARAHAFETWADISEVAAAA
jgi:hypothetical protein